METYNDSINIKVNGVNVEIRIDLVDYIFTLNIKNYIAEFGYVFINYFCETYSKGTNDIGWKFTNNKEFFTYDILKNSILTKTFNEHSELEDVYILNFNDLEQYKLFIKLIYLFVKKYWEK